VLFPDERPLVERLGAEFFQQAPQSPGVYLMRSGSEEVLYVGKAKNLRKRLGSYRVANPDRMSRRHLRLVNAVNRIELFECDSEISALAKEAALLRNLKPRFNRAGTWSAPAKYLAWRFDDTGVTFVVTAAAEPGWICMGARGSWAVFVRNALLRRIWCGVFPERGLRGMPPGWAHGKCGNTASILISPALAQRKSLIGALDAFVERDLGPLAVWIENRAGEIQNAFEKLALQEDMELLEEVCQKN
jgi:hypothetical protein